MKLYIASDHGGFAYKEVIKTFLQKLGHEIVDFGPDELDPEDDYPDYAFPLAQAVVSDHVPGILLCKNAVGVCIAANKVKGVRAGIGYSVYAAQSMKEDDHTNILCLPAKALDESEMLEILGTWLITEPSDEERHERRIEKIHSFEDLN